MDSPKYVNFDANGLHISWLVVMLLILAVAAAIYLYFRFDKDILSADDNSKKLEKKLEPIFTPEIIANKKEALFGDD